MCLGITFYYFITIYFICVSKCTILYQISCCSCACESWSWCLTVLVSALFLICIANLAREFLLGDVVLLNKALCLTDLWSALLMCCQSFMALILKCEGRIPVLAQSIVIYTNDSFCTSLAKPAHISSRELSSRALGWCL